MAGFQIEGATALVTGGNTGIGKETAIGLARRGARVVFTSRDPERGAAALAEIRLRSGSAQVEVMSLDLASFASIRRFAAELLAREARLQVLVNNAGVANFEGRSETEDGFELMFGVNHLGHFLLTGLLLPRIRESAPARIVVLSSEGYRLAHRGLRFDDLQGRAKYKGFPAYGHSKLANIYFARELSRRLEGSGVAVNAVHPGFVVTELGRPRPGQAARRAASDAGGGGPEEKPDVSNLPPPVSAEEGARTSIHLACAPELEGVTGGYFRDCAPCEPTEVARDLAAARRLWEESEKLVAAVAR